MSKLSKKEFLENYSSFPNFHKKLLDRGGVEWSLLKKHPISSIKCSAISTSFLS